MIVRLLALLAALALVPLALVALLLALLQSEAVRGWAEVAVDRFVPGVTVTGLGPGLPARLDVARITVADDAGTWLTVEDVALHWRPAALLNGRIEVARVGASRVALARTPAGEPRPADDAEPAPSGEPFALPESLPPVRIESLAVDRIELGAPVLGEAAVFGLEGALDAASGTMADLRLHLARLDREGLAADVEARLGLAERHLSLRVALEERSGLLTTLTGEPRLTPLTAELAGAGPLADWPGRLTLEAGTLAALTSELGVSLDPAPRLVLDGRIAPRAAIAETPYASLLGDGVALAATVEQRPEALEVARLEVGAAAFSLRGDGALRGETATANLALTLPALDAFAALTGTELDGSAELSIALDGPLPLPPGSIRLEGRGLEAAGVTVARLDQRLDLRAGDAGAIVFDAAGAIAGLSVPAGTDRFTDDIDLTARGTVTPGGPFALDALSLAGRSVTLEAEASGDLGAGALDLTGALRAPRLQAFRPFSPAAPAGSAEVRLTAALADGFARGTVTLDGAGRDIAELPPAAQALVGPAPTLEGEARLDGPDAPLRLERLTLEGALFTLAADGRFDPASGRGSAAAELAVPDLAPLGDALAQPLAGDVALTLEGEGGVDAVEAEARLTATPLTAAGQSFERIAVTLTAGGDPDRLDGDLEAVAAKAAGTVRLASAYTLTGERIDLRGLNLDAPGLGLRGDLAADLAPLALNGRLAGGSEDLEPLGRWLDVPLAGALDLALALSPDAQQSAELDATARTLTAAGVAIERVAVDATATDIFATPRVDLRADVARLTSGGTTVERADLTVAGGLDALAVTLEADGTSPQPFALAGAGDVTLADGTTTVTLTRLDGALDELPVRLAQPATLRVEDETLSLRGLDLEVDTGRLEGDATLGPERIEGRLELDGLEMERLADLGVPPFAGRLGARVELAGTRSAPVVDGGVVLSELRPRGGDGPPAAIDLAWRLGGGRLDATLATEGFGEPALAAEATVPVRFALAPFALTLPDPLPLDVAVDGAIDLRRVARWYGLEARLVEGRLEPDLAVGGTATAPRLDGLVTLTDARYADLATGVLVEDLRAEIAAEGQRLVVRELAASDGAQGRIGADGAIDFAGAEPSLDLRADMARFAVLQREDLFVVMSGDATVAGTGADLDVRGDFTVERGEIFLVGGDGAASFASLDVIERAAVTEDGEDVDAAGPGSTIDLDVGVDVPGRLFVRGRGLVSEWGGGLEIGGTAAEPRIRGTIAYRRGHFDIFDRRFELRRGEIQFTGASPPDPFLNVEATVELPDIVAVLGVQGPALDPELSISSEPPLPEDEIFSRLLFDQDQAQLNALQALRVAAAVRQLRGGGPGAFDRLRGLVGIDTLEIGGESMEDASVKAGTYVREDVFVEIERGLQPGSSGARVEVELTPRLNLETRVREDSTGSVGLRWSYDY